MKRSLAIAVFTAVMTGAVAAAATAAPVDELNRFAGTWRSEGTFLDTPYSKAGSGTATTTCEWSVDRAFMICQQRVMIHGAPDDDIAIYSYDDVGGTYRFYSIRPANSTSATITIAGDTITYPQTFTQSGKSVTVRTLNVWKSASLYTWRTEYSLDDGATWTLMASGTSRKQ